MLKLIHYNTDGDAKIIDMIGPRGFIGEIGFWNKEYKFGTIAIENTNLCYYDFNHFKTFILGNLDYAEKIRHKSMTASKYWRNGYCYIICYLRINIWRVRICNRYLEWLRLL